MKSRRTVVVSLWPSHHFFMNRIVSALLPLLAVMLTACGGGVRSGDLLFVMSSEDNAITQVTHGVAGYRIDHVAVSDGLEVVEAVPGIGVRATPADSFFLRHRAADGRSLVLVGRMRRSAQVDLQQSLANVRSRLGLPYDSLYLGSDEAIYCSELVQKSFVNRRGQLLFQPIPMEFRDSTGQVPSAFVRFYQQHGLPVPEGQPGSNPGQLSRSPLLSIRLRTK